MSDLYSPENRLTQQSWPQSPDQPKVTNWWFAHGQRHFHAIQGSCGTLAPPRGHRQIWHLTLFNQREQLFIPNLGFGWCICGGFVLNCKNLCEFRTVGSSLWPAVCHTQLQVCKNKVTAYAQIMPKLWKPGRQNEPETSLPKLREDDTNQRKQATKNWTTRPPSSSGNKRTNWGRRQII